MDAPGGADREVLQAARRWLAAGRRVALVTVARTWGSAPRPPGALLAMADDGASVGSVSGGCVEEDLVARFVSGEIGADGPTLVDYGVDPARAARFGLPCGGRLELVLEPLPGAAPLERLIAAMDAGRLLARRVCLDTGETSLHPARPGPDVTWTDGTLTKVFGARWDLLLIGAGQLARYCAPIARSLDFRVTVCDPRPEHAAAWDVEDVELLRLMPDDAVRERADHPRAVVVALSHDPKLDDMALMAALDSRAFYVGALGSRRTNEQRRERLAGLGLPPEAVARLHGPVGLPIGSRTPPEIAVAVMADLVAARNGVALTRADVT